VGPSPTTSAGPSPRARKAALRYADPPVLRPPPGGRHALGELGDVSARQERLELTWCFGVHRPGKVMYVLGCSTRHAMSERDLEASILRRRSVSHERGEGARHARRDIRLDIMETYIRRCRRISPGTASAIARHQRRTRSPHRKAADAGGAMGITCQKIGEVEVFVDAGVATTSCSPSTSWPGKDGPPDGPLPAGPGLAVVLDNEWWARAQRRGAEPRRRRPVSRRVRHGFGAPGCRRPRPAFDLAASRAAPRMQFRGLMTFPMRADTREFFERAIGALQGGGMPVPWSRRGNAGALHRQNIPMLRSIAPAPASSTTSWSSPPAPRPGTNCAMRVRATVVSRPTDAAHPGLRDQGVDLRPVRAERLRTSWNTPQASWAIFRGATASWTFPCAATPGGESSTWSITVRGQQHGG